MIVSEQDWTAMAEKTDSLEHYGRKGMKWYQHIYGDDPAKRKRSTIRSDSTSSKTAAKGRTDISKKREERLAKKERKEKERLEEEAKKQAKRRADNLRSPSKLYKHRNEYTQEEINNALKRFEWEKKLKDYSKAELQSGKEFIDRAVSYTISAINLYNQAARITNSFGLSDKPWAYIEPAVAKQDKNKK